MSYEGFFPSGGPSIMRVMADHYVLDQGSSLDLDEWVSTPPSWSNGLHHYWSDQGHVWTQISGYPLLHPGLTPPQDWSDQGASLDLDKWVSTPPSWSDPSPGLVGPGGIFGLR